MLYFIGTLRVYADCKLYIRSNNEDLQNSTENGEGMLCFYNTKDTEYFCEVTAHSRSINAIALSEEHRIVRVYMIQRGLITNTIKVATVGEDGLLAVWEIPNCGKKMNQLEVRF